MAERVCIKHRMPDGSVVDGPSDKILIPGNIFVIDTGSVYDEYYALLAIRCTGLHANF